MYFLHKPQAQEVLHTPNPFHVDLKLVDKNKWMRFIWLNVDTSVFIQFSAP